VWWEVGGGSGRGCLEVGGRSGRCMREWEEMMERVRGWSEGLVLRWVEKVEGYREGVVGN